MLCLTQTFIMKNDVTLILYKHQRQVWSNVSACIDWDLSIKTWNFGPNDELFTNDKVVIQSECSTLVTWSKPKKWLTLYTICTTNAQPQKVVTFWK